MVYVNKNSADDDSSQMSSSDENSEMGISILDLIYSGFIAEPYFRSLQ